METPTPQDSKIEIDLHHPGEMVVFHCDFEIPRRTGVYEDCLDAQVYAIPGVESAYSGRYRYNVTVAKLFDKGAIAEAVVNCLREAHRRELAAAA